VRLIAVLVLVVSGILLPAMPSIAAVVPQADQGLDGGWAIDDGGNVDFVHSLSSSLPTIYSAGAGWVRVVFRLGACYSNWTSVGCNGRTALQAYDTVVANVHAQGLRVLGTLTGESWPGDQTAWTANNAETVSGGTGDNPYVQAFAQNAASVLARHFIGQVGEWEVWNEPNAWTSTDGAGHFTGGTYVYPSNYAWLAQRSYTAIKSAALSNVVIFGGLFGHQPIGASTLALGRPVKRADMPGARKPPVPGHSVIAQAVCMTHAPAGADSGASYLCATYSVGEGYLGWVRGAYPFDNIGQHLYLDIGGSANANDLNFYLNDLRQAYIAYEGSATPKRTEVTEVGWPTDQVTPAVQASDLATAFQTLHGTNYVARAFWFDVQDAPEAALYYGLVDTNASPKPSYSAYQQNAVYTAPPQPCSPRPRVSMSVSPLSPGVLRVIITAGAGTLDSIAFGNSSNAMVTAGTISGAPGNFSVAPGTQSFTFTVRRVTPGVAATLLLTATDACGTWPTLVGGGPTAF
jgi:hypothetical protein